MSRYASAGKAGPAASAREANRRLQTVAGAV